MDFKEPTKASEDVEREIVVEGGINYKPQILSVDEKGEIFPWGDYEYIPEQSDVVEKVWWKYFDSKRNKYVLLSEIAALQYLFRLSGEECGDSFYLSFKTLEYEFAVTNLDEENTQELFEKLADFLETAYIDSNKKILLLDISPADSSYSASDIENCILEITKNTKEYSEEELREKFKGFKIFDVYRKIIGKDFGDEHYNAVSKARARARYFKVKFRKYLKNWEILESYRNSITFSLKRKEELIFSEEKKIL